MTKNKRSFIRNRKAAHSYFIYDRFEAGVALRGSEVKSIRAGRANLVDSYVRIADGEAYIVNMHISPYQQVDNAYDPRRTRKLLLHKNEIIKLGVQTNRKGYTIIPLEMYFSKGKAKLEIAVCKGKHAYDKREAIKKKEHAREIDRAVRKR